MMVPFVYMWKEAAKFRRIFPWLLLALAGFALAKAWPNFSENASKLESYTTTVVLLIYRIIPLAAAILMSMVVSQEIERKTIVFLLTRPIHRWKLLLGRWLAVTTVLTLIGLICIGLTWLGAGRPAVNWGNELLAVVVGSVAYGSLFLLVTILINRGLLVCVLFAFGWEASLPNLAEGMQLLSVLKHMQNLAAHPRGGNPDGILEQIAGPIAVTFPSISTSLIALLGISAFCLVVSAAVFSTREFVPREDA